MIVAGTQKINLGYLGKVENRNSIDLRKVIELYKNEHVANGAEPNLTMPHTTMCVDNDYYYVFEGRSEITLYKKLPLVTNDELLKWKENSMNPYVGKTYRSEVWRGFIQFEIAYRLATDKTTIHVYEKRGRGTRRHLNTILIDNGDNEAIKKAIEGWIDTFKWEVENL